MTDQELRELLGQADAMMGQIILGMIERAEATTGHKFEERPGGSIWLLPQKNLGRDAERMVFKAQYEVRVFFDGLKLKHIHFGGYV